MASGQTSLMHQNPGGPLSFFPAADLASSLADLFRALSSEHTKRVAIEARCRVLVAQIMSQNELDCAFLMETFRKQGIALESLLAILAREAASGTGCTDMFRMLLEAVLTILNSNPIDHISRRSGPFTGFDQNTADEYSDAEYD